MGDEETARNRLELDKEQEEREKMRNGGEESKWEFTSAFLCLNSPLHGDSVSSLLYSPVSVRATAYSLVGLPRSGIKFLTFAGPSWCGVY